jgi:hypothetical protein
MSKTILPLRDKLPLSRALLGIFLYTLMISGTAWMGWLYYVNVKKMRVSDDQYQLIAIVQSSPQKEGLNTDYLAELLNLSVDRPINLYQFNINEGLNALFRCPLIKNASIQKILPGTLYVDYRMRVPEAHLGDYVNMSMDSEGFLFPLKPFFTPKKLPLVYLGLNNPDLKYGESIREDERFRLAFEILGHLKKIWGAETLDVKQVDVSHAFAESYGQKQIVVLVEDQSNRVQEGRTVSVVKPIFLRLNPKEYRQNLANFMVLRKHLRAARQIATESGSLKGDVVQLSPAVIDLRIAQLAFIKEWNKIEQSL